MSSSLPRTVRITLLFAALALALRASAEVPWEGDVRLEQRVTVEAEGVPLGELLALLSEKTGIRFSARGDIAEDKVIVFARRRTLNTLLDDLAALFDYTWERKREAVDTQPSYELFMSRRALNRQNALMRASQQRISAQIDEFVTALALSPEELASLPDGNPIREYLGNANTRTGLQLYALLTPAQRQALWAERRLSAPYSSLTPAQQEAVAAVMDHVIAEIHKNREKYRDNPEVYNRITVPRMEDLPGGLVQFRLRKIGGNMLLLLQLPGAGIPVAGVATQSAWLLPPHGEPYVEKPSTPSEPLPVVSDTKAALSAGNSILDRLRHLAGNSSFTLLADFYRSRPFATPLENAPAEPLSSMEALDALCHEPGYLWWKRGDALLFRKRDWYVQRTMEVPDSFYLALAERVKANGGRLTVADLLRLRTLTQAQIAGMNSIFTPLADESLLDGLPELLALIAALPPRRAEALFGPEGPGLVAADLSPQTQKYALAFARVQTLLNGPQDAPGFVVRMNTRLRPSSRPGVPTGTQVELKWTLGNRNGVYYLFMPHALPDDHRAATRVETDR
ncbi:MAG TPA: hypothetical protein VNJ09_05305 [Chthonomonadales bacterium]|nr:hypothetical protein [Chthonomonadales bacterium]